MKRPATAPAIEVRHCATLAEYDECVRLEHLTWGEDIAVPSAMFVVAHHTGGQVLGAFADGNMVGFTLAFAATRHGKLFLHSHMTAVLEAFRDGGVGRQLKLFQRQDALRRGIELIEWTFDPLEMRNAHFNLVRLGAISRRYIPDCYGVTESPLHRGLPTDRLVAEWWLASERVRGILADDPAPASEAAVRIAVPANPPEPKSRKRAAALQIQSEARAEFQKWFLQGYVATGTESGTGTSDYFLEPVATIAGLRLTEIVDSES
jgi:predicted GNAT superfamily acetyltransferase